MLWRHCASRFMPAVASPATRQRGTFYFSRWYHTHRDVPSQTAKPLRAGFRLHTLQHANDFVDGIHVGGGFSFFQATERFGPDPRAAGQISLRQTGRLPPADNLARQAVGESGDCLLRTPLPTNEPSSGEAGFCPNSSASPTFQQLAKPCRLFLAQAAKQLFGGQSAHTRFRR